MVSLGAMSRRVRVARDNGINKVFSAEYIIRASPVASAGGLEGWDAPGE